VGDSEKFDMVFSKSIGSEFVIDIVWCSDVLGGSNTFCLEVPSAYSSELPENSIQSSSLSSSLSSKSNSSPPRPAPQMLTL
jgi:hypothetical protein